MNNYIVYGIVSSINPTPSDMGDRFILSNTSSSSIYSAKNNCIVHAGGTPSNPKWVYETPEYGDTAQVIKEVNNQMTATLYKYSSVNGWELITTYQLV